MTVDKLYIDLLAFAADAKPAGGLEARLIDFLEGDSSTESLDSAAFDQINGSNTKADYLLGARGLVAELKTLNASPQDRTEQRLRERFSRRDAPIVFGTLGISDVIEKLRDRDAISKMMVDMAGRAVRRHLQKANDQIGAIKTRLRLPNAGGLLILMNEAEPMIDLTAIGYTLKTAFETVDGGYPHISNVWAIVESHRIAMPGGRNGFPHLHVFKSLERQGELDYIGRMLGAWGYRNGSRMERLQHHGDWNVMLPIYDGPPPTLRPFA
ncbi:hypothetical protein [Methylobacterium sp. WL116]|uniref:hypothetical protein n=1 Tax=Methylobacterium sp. WL116 TaxID=2603889 RepID=UPI0011C87894|nr:hypothetical protein [Methylobacterium sp. WL116]TXM94697.1 hypothetical protein FV223_03640 [Methylobacterium sp. WL116]